MLILYILILSLIVGCITMGFGYMFDGRDTDQLEEESLLASLIDVEKALTTSLLNFYEQLLHIGNQIERLEEKGGSQALIEQYHADAEHLEGRSLQVSETLYSLWRTRMLTYFRWEYTRLSERLPILPSFTELEGEDVYKNAHHELDKFTLEVQRVYDIVTNTAITPPEHLEIPQDIYNEILLEKEATETLLRQLLAKVDSLCDQILYVQDWFRAQQIDKESRNVGSLNRTKEEILSSVEDLNQLLLEDVNYSVLQAGEQVESQLRNLKSISLEQGERIRAEREVDEVLRHLSKQKHIHRRRIRSKDI